MANRSSSRTPTPGTANGGRPTTTAPSTADVDRRRGRTQLQLAAVIGLLLVAGAGYWATRGGGDQSTATPTASNGSAKDLTALSGQGAAQPPPWAAPADVRSRAAKAGLPLGAMGMAEHYHVHVDILVDGKPIPVPANIGVDQVSGAMSYLHTHTPDGLVHIEAGEKGQPFTLGQLFTQWDVRLTRDQLGALHTSDEKTLAAYVNGTKVTGDPALLRLRPHQQIALVYSPVGAEVVVPDGYDFPAGS